MRIKSMEFYKVSNTQLFISSHTQKKTNLLQNTINLRRNMLRPIYMCGISEL